MDMKMPDTDRRQLLMIIGSLMVALGLAYMLFFSGSGSAETPSPFEAPDAAEAQAIEEKTKSKAGKNKKGPVETFEVFAARDPFEPLVPQGSDNSGSSGNEDTTGGVSGATEQESSTKTVDGHRVKLVDVFTKNDKAKAQVQVDSTVYTVDEGEVFADNFQVLSISGECASMLFGDDQFTLCEGEEILK